MAGEKVEVQAGDTVYSVARQYKVSMRELIAINRLQAPFSLTPGQTLTLPANDNIVMVDKERAVPVKAPVEEKVEARAEAKAAGMPEELVPPSAEKYAPYREAKAAPQDNEIKTYSQVVEAPEPQKVVAEAQLEDRDTVLYAPSGAIDKPAVISGKKTQKFSAQAEKILKKPAAPDYSRTVAEDAVVVEEKPKTPMPKDKVQLVETLNLKPMKFDKNKQKLVAPPKDTHASAPQQFIWPVQGPVLSTFGPKSNGLRNDGLNIGAPRGTPVVAAESGTVAYAGSDIPGFGNVVLVRHPSGMMSTYAHLERMFVQKDTVVAKGDMVGTVGTSGGLDTPQLHFEVRRDKEALDPGKYLYR